MATEHFKHEKDKIREYQQKGFTASYRFKDNTLQDVETKKTYNAQEITLVEEYRYEGFSNPSDLSILYVLEMIDGTKGTLLAAYGPEADAELAWFLKDVEKNQSKS